MIRITALGPSTLGHHQLHQVQIHKASLPTITTKEANIMVIRFKATPMATQANSTGAECSYEKFLIFMFIYFYTFKHRIVPIRFCLSDTIR